MRLWGNGYSALRPVGWLQVGQDWHSGMISTRQKTLRLFFALWPSAAERAALAAWQLPLQKMCGGRTMQPKTLHVTLLFLGAVAESRLEALQLAAQEVEFGQFDLELDQAHYWNHNRLVYAAPGVVPFQLAGLVNSLQAVLSNHDFKFDRRPYKPHVTLIRKAKWGDAPLPGQFGACWQIRDFVLVQSLGEEVLGSRYEVLAWFPARTD